jgi:hypothetical protein
LNGVYKAVIRFLPNPVDPANKSIITKNTVWMTHPLNKTQRSIDCPSSIGEADPLSNTYWALVNSTNAVLKENAKFFSRKIQYASLVQVLQCDSEPALVNKILVWRYGIKIHEKLQGEMNPPMGEPKNPFNLFTGRPFSVSVKEVGGFPNYDACGFFDLPIDQSGMRIITNNAQGQPQVYVVTENTIGTDQGKQMVFNYLKDNAPDMSKYEYHAWDAETTQFVNECIRVYTNPQLTIKAMSEGDGLTTQVGQMPMQAQAAAMPMQSQPQMTKPGNTQAFAPQAQMPQMPIETPQMPQMGPQIGLTGLDGVPGMTMPGATANNLSDLPADLENILNGGDTTSAAPTASNQPLIDLNSVML